MAKKTKKPIPSYIKNIYSWLYLNPFLYNILDNSIVQNILTLGNHSKLIKELNKDLIPHSKVLQIGTTLGAQVEKTYLTLGAFSTYTIVDVLENQLKNCNEKHLEQRINFIHADASKVIEGTYDTIICYFILHELPPKTREKLLTNLTKALKENGKIIFIDYHLPSSYNPLKYTIRAFNRLYQPFAESLWKKSIKETTPNSHKFTWSKQTYFGGVYQKVVATKNN